MSRSANSRMTPTPTLNVDSPIITTLPGAEIPLFDDILPDQIDDPMEDWEPEEIDNPDDPLTPWKGIVIAQEFSGLTVEAILHTIGWLNDPEDEQWRPCLNCLHYGWDEDMWDEPDGSGHCANCMEERHDYDPAAISNAWLQSQPDPIALHNQAIALRLA